MPKSVKADSRQASADGTRAVSQVQSELRVHPSNFAQGHPIADAHPGDLDAIIFPGQDYNNARISDFADVDNWKENKRKHHS